MDAGRKKTAQVALNTFIRICAVINNFSAAGRITADPFSRRNPRQEKKKEEELKIFSCGVTFFFEIIWTGSAAFEKRFMKVQ